MRFLITGFAVIILLCSNTFHKAIASLYPDALLTFEESNKRHKKKKKSAHRKKARKKRNKKFSKRKNLRRKKSSRHKKVTKRKSSRLNRKKNLKRKNSRLNRKKNLKRNKRAIKRKKLFDKKRKSSSKNRHKQNKHRVNSVYPYRAGSITEAVQRITGDAVTKLANYYVAVPAQVFQPVVEQYIMNHQRSFILPTNEYKFIGGNGFAIAALMQSAIRDAVLASSLRAMDNSAAQRYTDYIMSHPREPDYVALRIFQPPYATIKQAFQRTTANIPNLKSLIESCCEFAKTNADAVSDWDSDTAIDIAQTINTIVTNYLNRHNIDSMNVPDLVRPLNWTDSNQKIKAFQLYEKMTITLATLKTSCSRRNEQRGIYASSLEADLMRLTRRFGNAAGRIIDAILAATNATLEDDGGNQYDVALDTINPDVPGFLNNLASTRNFYAEQMNGLDVNMALLKLIEIAGNNQEIFVSQRLNGNVPTGDLTVSRLIEYASLITGILGDNLEDWCRGLRRLNNGLTVSFKSNNDLRESLLRTVIDAVSGGGAFASESGFTGMTDTTTGNNIRRSITNMANRHPNYATDATTVLDRLINHIQTNHGSNPKSDVAIQVLHAVSGQPQNNVFAGSYACSYSSPSSAYGASIAQVIQLVWREIERLPHNNDRHDYMTTLIDRLFEIRFAHSTIPDPSSITDTSGYAIVHGAHRIESSQGWSCGPGFIERLIEMFDFSTFHNDVYVHDRSATVSSTSVDWDSFSRLEITPIDRNLRGLSDIVAYSDPVNGATLEFSRELYNRLLYVRMFLIYKCAVERCNTSDIDSMLDLRLRLLVWPDARNQIGPLIY